MPLVTAALNARQNQRAPIHSLLFSKTRHVFFNQLVVAGAVLVSWLKFALQRFKFLYHAFSAAVFQFFQGCVDQVLRRFAIPSICVQVFKRPDAVSDPKASSDGCAAEQDADPTT